MKFVYSLVAFHRQYNEILTLKVLVATLDAQWCGMGDVGVSEVWAGTTSPLPDHKGFKLQ